eukprot:jgi/Hompol1/3114/HPOL_006345-RA
MKSKRQASATTTTTTSTAATTTASTTTAKAAPLTRATWIHPPKELQTALLAPLLLAAYSRLLPPAWEWLRTNFDQHQLLLWGTIIVTSGFYWAYGSLLAVLDLLQWPAALWRFKIQPKIFVNLPLTFLFERWVTVSTKRNILSEELPSIPELLFQIVVFAVIEEVGFYSTHRLMHQPKLYKAIHKKHHEFTAPIAIAA